MRVVYLDFRLPWPAKIAAGMCAPGKWRPFEIYLTTTWTAPYSDHTYLGFSSIKSSGFFTKKEAILYFAIKTILEHRRTVHASIKSKITLMLYKLWFILAHRIKFFHVTLDCKLGKNKKKCLGMSLRPLAGNLPGTSVS
jgi:hypothetical protein